MRRDRRDLQRRAACGSCRCGAAAVPTSLMRQRAQPRRGRRGAHQWANQEIGAVGEVGLLAELAAGLQVLLVGFLVVEIAGRLLAQH